ncbi:MAG TPA: NepR family anti-sigma factor [Roseiarcus sp.]
MKTLGMLIMNAARVTKFEKLGPAPDLPVESGAEAVQAIGRALEAHYADLVQAPLPDKFLQLLARLGDDKSVLKAAGKRDALG